MEVVVMVQALAVSWTGDDLCHESAVALVLLLYPENVLQRCFRESDPCMYDVALQVN